MSAPPADGGPALAPEPLFSLESGVFTNDTITFSLSTTSGVIHYTLDGSVPTETSPVYTAPFTVGTNVVIKARTFQAGLEPGPVASRTYHFLDAGARDFDSNLPILILNTSGRAIPDNVPPGELRAPGSLVVFKAAHGRTSLQGAPEFIGLAEFEIFGQTSAGFPKLPYTIEIQDEWRNDRHVPLLGMPAEADWKLRTLYNDKSFINEALAFELFEQMGHYAVRRRFVEVFVDKSGGKVSYPQDYVGIMLLMERIERGADRVPLARLGPSHVAEPEITGGYIWKKEKDSNGDLNFVAGGHLLKLHEPKPQTMRSFPTNRITTFPGPNYTAAASNQLNYLIAYLNAFNAAMNSSNWLTATGTNRTNHYSHYIDVDSFVDQHWIVEFTKNIDGYRLGNYMQKDRGGKIRMDLLWDWELSFGNADYLDGGRTNGWYYTLTGAADHIWLRRLMGGNPLPNSGGDPDFVQKLIDRWGVLRTNAFDPAKVLARVDELAVLLGEASGRDFAKYPRLGTYVWPNPNGGPNWHVDYVRPTNYLGIINELKKWIVGRQAWIDGQFAKAPFFNHPGGRVPAGFSLLVGAHSGTVYYTLDGTDPRATGGSIAAGARPYDGPISVDGPVRIFARTFSPTNGWSPPAVATFFVTLPPLRVTEIMYHSPAPPSGAGAREDFDYLELRNTGSVPLEIGGYRLGGAVEFVFPELTLPAGGYVLVVKNRAAFEWRYGGGPPIAGEYAGALGDVGGRIVLEGRLLEPILDFSYDDAWYPATDGLGFSLAIVDDTAPPASWNLASSWRPSGLFSGSPGQPDPGRPDFPRVVINEVLPHVNSPSADAIELRNLSANDAPIGGWFLSDDFNQPRKYRIPDNTAIAAGGFRVFNGADFNPSPGVPEGFALSRLGDSAYLFSGDAATNLTGYVHGVGFGAQKDGGSFGRHLNSVGEEHFVSQATATLGAENAGPLVGAVVINEIMYQPSTWLGNGALSGYPTVEYLELFNRSAAPVRLFDADHPANTWSLRNAVEFDFPPDTVMPAGGFLLVVGFEPKTPLFGLKIAWLCE